MVVSAGLLELVPVAVNESGKPVVSPGVAGFLVTFALALATLLLIRSMVKHLRKVRYGPEPPQDVVPRLPEQGHEGVERDRKPPTGQD